mgnify:CR=1 FL=1
MLRETEVLFVKRNFLFILSTFKNDTYCKYIIYILHLYFPIIFFYDLFHIFLAHLSASFLLLIPPAGSPVCGPALYPVHPRSGYGRFSSGAPPPIGPKIAAGRAGRCSSRRMTAWAAYVSPSPPPKTFSWPSSSSSVTGGAARCLSNSRRVIDASSSSLSQNPSFTACTGKITPATSIPVFATT